MYYETSAQTISYDGGKYLATGDLQGQLGLVDLYRDFPLLKGSRLEFLQPYFGAGLGFSYLGANALTSRAFARPGSTRAAEINGGEFTFAYHVQFGASIALTDETLFTLDYHYVGTLPATFDVRQDKRDRTVTVSGLLAHGLTGGVRVLF